MKKCLVFFCVLCVVLLLVPPISHGTSKKKKAYEPEVKKWWERPKVVKKLGLTDGQLSRVREIYDEYLNQIVEDRWNYRHQKGLLEDLLTKADLDQDEIDRQTGEVEKARAALEKTMMQMQTETMKELSPEQRRELLSILKKWEDTAERSHRHKRKDRRK
ncbi:MAG TPA: periplasmic heavy metal sensor [Syntrophales bacterium]|nr:periplasmic heavy metal sensor [Syntrophales bacterium]